MVDVILSLYNLNYHKIRLDQQLKITCDVSWTNLKKQFTMNLRSYHDCFSDSLQVWLLSPFVFFCFQICPSILNNIVTNTTHIIVNRGDGLETHQHYKKITINLIIYVFVQVYAKM